MISVCFLFVSFPLFLSPSCFVSHSLSGQRCSGSGPAGRSPGCSERTGAVQCVRDHKHTYYKQREVRDGLCFTWCPNHQTMYNLRNVLIPTLLKENLLQSEWLFTKLIKALQQSTSNPLNSSLSINVLCRVARYTGSFKIQCQCMF